MYAFITKRSNNGVKGYQLEIRSHSDVSQGESVLSTWTNSKVQARALAHYNNAKPWNF